MIKVITHATTERWEREISFSDRHGLTADARFQSWKLAHSTIDAGHPTPFTASNGERGTVYLPAH